MATTPSFTHCDADALPAETTAASSLTPDRFYKLCPGSHLLQTADNESTSTTTSESTYAPFGQPRCGDGSNFSFLASLPKNTQAYSKKIMIEFAGGGACWNQVTCNMQKSQLTLGTYLNNFVGMSCSQIASGMKSLGFPSSMLCDRQIGNTDFTEYTTIMVPYCTQDVHIGDAPNVTYGEEEDVVHHVGGHNMYRTLDWVFTNFPDATDVFLTGCSAGGTALPFAYDMVNEFYNSRNNGDGMANVNVVMDSAVYLTPSTFLENYYNNWNPATMLQQIGFDDTFDSKKYDEDFPNLILDHVLARGGPILDWGFITHNSDPVSFMYYVAMGGDADETKWWTEMKESMDLQQSKHDNVEFFVIDGNGHCSFGLHLALEEDGFEEWMAPIVSEDKSVEGNSSGSTILSNSTTSNTATSTTGAPSKSPINAPIADAPSSIKANSTNSLPSESLLNYGSDVQTTSSSAAVHLEGSLSLMLLSVAFFLRSIV
jgi:hypothetical protein